MRLLTELLPDQERVLGPGDKHTLNTRSTIASLTGDVGEGWEVLRLFTELLSHQEQALGPDHPDVLDTRSNVATWTGRVGNGWEALRLFTELLPDQERVLGRDHPDALRTRSNVADWTGELGDRGEALRLFAKLLPDEERVLGRDHPTTLGTLLSIAKFAIGNSDQAEACRWLHEGLERALPRFGRDHLITKAFHDLIESCGCDGPGSPGCATAGTAGPPAPTRPRSVPPRRWFSQASLILDPSIRDEAGGRLIPGWRPGSRGCSFAGGEGYCWRCAYRIEKKNRPDQRLDICTLNRNTRSETNGGLSASEGTSRRTRVSLRVLAWSKLRAPPTTRRCSRLPEGSGDTKTNYCVGVEFGVPGNWCPRNLLRRCTSSGARSRNPETAWPAGFPVPLTFEWDPYQNEGLAEDAQRLATPPRGSTSYAGGRFVPGRRAARTPRPADPRSGKPAPGMTVCPR